MGGDYQEMRTFPARRNLWSLLFRSFHSGTEVESMDGMCNPLPTNTGPIMPGCQNYGLFMESHFNMATR